NWLLIFLIASFAGGLTQLMIFRVTGAPPSPPPLVLPASDDAELAPDEPLDAAEVPVAALLPPAASLDDELQPAAASIARIETTPVTVPTNLRLIMSTPFRWWVGPRPAHTEVMKPARSRPRRRNPRWARPSRVCGWCAGQIQAETGSAESSAIAAAPKI